MERYVLQVKIRKECENLLVKGIQIENRNDSSDITAKKPKTCCKTNLPRGD